MAIGIALAGALFYATVNNHFLGAILVRTLGPYSDTLVERGLTDPDPTIWARIARRHEVAILVEPADGFVVAYDADGRSIEPAAFDEGPIRAIRKGPDGSRVTLSWRLSAFQYSHYPLMGGLLVMVVAVVGSAFWFLQRQLRPLAALHQGVDAVSRGDFATRVPIVRNDEIGEFAGAFNQMAGRVGEMIDDRERLLADVSHELRSPIARMKVALELMPPSDKRDALARDLREMENLIAVLLEREALRSRAGRLDGEEVDLDALVCGAVEALADRGPGVRVESAGPLMLHADPSLLRLLIQNLIDNAIKFSLPDSGPVTIRLETARSDAVLTVADDGTGIDTEREEDLFKPFVKQDPSRGHRAGYGIGLNLCQRIARLHGGTIRLRPRTPRGTEAIVTLSRVLSSAPDAS